MTTLRTLTLCLLALALFCARPQSARADWESDGAGDLASDDPVWTIFPPAPADAANQNNATWLTPETWSISLLIPIIGELRLPSDADWDGGNLSFQWFDGANVAGTGGIYQIDGSFLELQDTPLSHDDIAALTEFTKGLLVDELQAEIISSQDNLVYAGRSWNEIYFREPAAQDEAGPTSSYCFFTPEGKGMYILVFYCDDPPNDVVAADISTVLGDFIPAGDAAAPTS